MTQTAIDQMEQNLAKFEALAYTCHEETSQALIALIDALSNHCKRKALTELADKKRNATRFYTRIASAITAWISNQNLSLTINDTHQLILKKRHLHYIFSASSYTGADHLISIFYEKREDGSVFIQNRRLITLLTFLSLDEVPNRFLSAALGFPSHILLPLMVGWLHERAVLTEQGEKNRSRLLESGHLIENNHLPESLVTPVVLGWMYSSYASASHKHNIKASYNRLLLNRMKRGGLTLSPPVRNCDKQKPRLLVIHERFFDGHAMYRCYAPVIAPLKNYFELLSLSDKTAIDNTASEIFDQTLLYDKTKENLGKIIRKIQSLSPDAIYYPSIGMDDYIIHLANLRLAPIQFAGQGHPATTQCKTIDYVYLRNAPDETHKLYTERLLMGHEKPLYEPHHELTSFKPENKDNTTFKVAINSKVMKLSWRLLKICQQLKSHSKIDIQFHFFPAEFGINHDGIKSLIEKYLEGSIVHPVYGYTEFMGKLSQCHLSLAAFPFGNTNGTIDCCHLKIPTVAYYDLEFSSQTDARIIRSLGLPDILINDTDDKYFQTALRLINDREFYTSILYQFDRIDISDLMHTADKADSSTTDMAELFHYVYHNHESIQSDQKQIIRYNELSADSVIEP